MRAQLAQIFRTSTQGWQVAARHAHSAAWPAVRPPFIQGRDVDLGDGLFVAGDHREMPGVPGAVRSGRRAAQADRFAVGRPGQLGGVALARWRNACGAVPVIPPAVIERPPSAELRANQTDQDSLPPYEMLDAILLRHVDQEQSRADILAAGFDPGIVDHVLTLVRTSEWKRHQAAPGPKVSRRAFGRERRYPISNGYRE